MMPNELGQRFAAAVQIHDVPEDEADRTPPRLVPVPVGTLMRLHPHQRPPVIDGILRTGETANIIAPSKGRKSWTIMGMALCVATGREWLGFPTRACKVLMLDNELHPEVLAHRIPIVADALAIPHAEYADRIDVVSLRGKMLDLPTIADELRRFPGDEYGLVTVDALYRTYPKGTDENSNADGTALYNAIDAAAAHLGAAVVIVHHGSKGSQADKRVSDVGAGAGAISRAADVHLVLREHEEPDAVVLDAVLRSFPPIEPRCLRWTFPAWEDAPDLDPEDLKRPGPRKGKSDKAAAPVKEAAPEWTPQMLVDAFLGTDPRSRDSIIEAAKRAKLSEKLVLRLLGIATETGIAFRHQKGANTKARFATVPPTESSVQPEGENEVLCV